MAKLKRPIHTKFDKNDYERYKGYIKVTDNLKKELLEEGGVDGDLNDLVQVMNKEEHSSENLEFMNTIHARTIVIQLVKNIIGTEWQTSPEELPESIKDGVERVKVNVKGKVYYRSIPIKWTTGRFSETDLIKRQVEKISTREIYDNYKIAFPKIPRTKNSIYSKVQRIRKKLGFKPIRRQKKNEI